MVLDTNAFFLAFIILLVILVVIVLGLFFLGKKWEKLKYLWSIILMLIVFYVLSRIF